CPISALHEKFNPRNINHMPAVKFSARLDLDQIILFLDGHKLTVNKRLICPYPIKRSLEKIRKNFGPPPNGPTGNRANGPTVSGH
ncbi:MAG: hypothetical protein P8Z73_05550, partial [Desulfobacteraceae bacterium]